MKLQVQLWPSRLDTDEASKELVEAERFTSKCRKAIDIYSRSKPNTQVSLDESIGEVLCDECNGWGNLYSKDESHLVRCQKCWGIGKLDWIERVVGKKPEFYGTSGSAFYGTSGPLTMVT